MGDSLSNLQLGQYHLVEEVGRGGMATVYKAYQASLDRFVAVKVMHRSDDPQFIARFQREARAIASLQHHNILPIYNYGEQDGWLYFVLQYIEYGVSLSSLLNQPMPLASVLRLMRHVLAALDYAHSRGVIHRDVKPTNILMPEPNWPMLSDFGIARLVNEDQRLTLSGLIVGTAAYMAPEQAIGQPTDARTDLYAAGVTLYEMLTGRVPFEGDTPVVVLTKHVVEPPPSPRSFNPDLSSALEAVLLRALAKDPAERYQSAAEMAEELELIAGQVDQPQTWNQIARLYQSGIRAFEERRWDLAIMRFAQLLAFDPNYEDAADLMAAARDAQERARVEALHQTQLVHQSAVVPRRSTPSLSASPLRRSTPSLSASPLRAGSPTLLLSPQPAVTAVVSHDALDAVRAPSPRRDWRWPAVPVVLVMLLLLGGIGTRQREGPGSQGASATAPPSSAQAPLSLPTIRQGLIDAIVAPAAAAELLASSTSVVPKVFQALTEQTTPEASTRQTPTLTAPKPTPATAKPLPAAGAASAEVILLQVAEAEAALRMGQLEATITYGSGARSSARVRFDLGDEQRVPCFQIITTYEGAKSIQTTERITIGDQSWERQQDSQSTAMPARESALKQLQVFLPRTDSISDIKRVTAEGRYVLRWYDSARDADVTLRVDAAGIPQQLRRVSRANGLVLTVTYSDWNTPVEISPPTAN